MDVTRKMLNHTNEWDFYLSTEDSTTMSLATSAVTSMAMATFSVVGGGSGSGGGSNVAGGNSGDIINIANDGIAQLHTKERVVHIQQNFIIWAVVDVTLMILILSGNTLTILAISLSRRIRSITSNMFILSLAISDMLVGFTLPYHSAFYMDTKLGNIQTWCMMRFFFIILACTVSISNLIAIAVDRYVAIVYPLHYVRYVTRRVAFLVMCLGWLMGLILALVPMFWNNWDTAKECEFDDILPPWYVAGIITPLFGGIWIIMMVLYAKIWMEASRHAKQLRSSLSGLNEGGTSDWKSIQVVLLILGCFSICWLPYFIVATAQIFQFMDESSPTLYKAAFSMAIANSGMNPIIYAWKNSTFRIAFGRLLRCKSPNQHDCLANMSWNNTHRRSSTLPPRDDSINEQHQSQLPPPAPTLSSALTPQPIPISLPTSTLILSGTCSTNGSHTTTTTTITTMAIPHSTCTTTKTTIINSNNDSIIQKNCGSGVGGSIKINKSFDIKNIPEKMQFDSTTPTTTNLPNQRISMPEYSYYKDNNYCNCLKYPDYYHHHHQNHQNTHRIVNATTTTPRLNKNNSFGEFTCVNNGSVGGGVGGNNTSINNINGNRIINKIEKHQPPQQFIQTFENKSNNVNAVVMQHCDNNQQQQQQQQQQQRYHHNHHHHNHNHLAGEINFMAPQSGGSENNFNI